MQSEDYDFLLKRAFTSRPFRCPAGTLAVREEDLILFYGKPQQGTADSDIRRLDFVHARDDELKRLSEACDPATFGLDQQDVYDEAYRKAGKLDCAHFAMGFDPAQSGLIDLIRDSLLEGHGSDVGIRYELYKLNVYGPGSFFKAHKDTPRGSDMFASLVVVLPAPHQGGALVLRHHGRDFTFDSADMLFKAATPSVAFAAFYSDIDHEVLPVMSGYRITLTYNIFFKHDHPLDAFSLSIAQEKTLKETCVAAMKDEKYYPSGTTLGFGLRHDYALQDDPNLKLASYVKLKGSDSVLLNVCKELQLKTSLGIVYSDDDVGIFYQKKASFGGRTYGDDAGTMWSHFRWLGGLLLWSESEDDSDDEDDSDSDDEGEDDGEEQSVPNSNSRLHVEWVSDMEAKGVKGLKDSVITYGNEAAIGQVYGHLCLLVHVGPKNNRQGGLSADDVLKASHIR